ncbi:MAG: TlpA family protein disulfide reductase [Myxococcales bacterium]|nr:TlpA family protein disulfide reductase [Myxococcales bacterium]
MRGKPLAAAIALSLGAALVFLFTQAVIDGERRRREAPLKALLGDSGFERLMRGEPSDQHYLGNSLLAPDFSLKDKDGKPWRLSDHRGRVVVLNFWSITCPPCVEEMPSLSDLAQLTGGRDDIELVAISTDADWQTVASVVPAGSNLKVLFDPDKAVVGGKFGTKLYPETWIIDRRGVIRLRVDGKRNWSAGIALDAIESFL